MDRRSFLIGGLAAIAAPLPAEAQQVGKVHRIGVLGNANDPPWDGFRKRLRDLGYVDGRNVSMEWRWSEGKPDRFPALAMELVALRPEVIVASGIQASLAAKRATAAIPIVMALSAYPDKLGLVGSLAHPGGNVTGLTIAAPDLGGKRLELLKEVSPKVSRVGLIWNPDNPVETLGFPEVTTAASAIGVVVQSIEVRRAEDYPTAFTSTTSSSIDALFVVGNPVNFKGRNLIVEFALKRRLPSVYDERLFVEAGGLMSYAPSYADLFRRAAGYVDRILKGTKPGDLPVEQPTTFELIINVKTAKALGLTIPPSLLLRADQVIE